MNQKVKILLYNPCYFREIGGKFGKNLKLSYRHIFCSVKVQKRCIQQFVELIKKEKPDVVCLVEVENGSLTNRYFNQTEYLAAQLLMHGTAENKYTPGHFLKYNPIYIGKSNGFLSREPLNFEKHFLSRSFKSLVYVVELKPGLHLFMVHLPTFSAKKRREHILEIKELTKKYDKVIICGDFNTYRGVSELEPFLLDQSFALLNSPHDVTFPSAKPKYLLDLFLVSKSITGSARITVINHYQSSDHLPVLFELGGL